RLVRDQLGLGQHRVVRQRWHGGRAAPRQAVGPGVDERGSAISRRNRSRTPRRNRLSPAGGGGGRGGTGGSGALPVRGDGGGRPPERWRRRQAAAIVKILALARHRTMHREQLLDLLWPQIDVAEAAPRLHKAAHYARRGLPGNDALVLRGDTVSLLPDTDVTVDVLEFESAAGRAIDEGGVSAAGAALPLYGGELLPEDLYEPWTEITRQRTGLLYRQLLRQAGRWEQVLALD